MARKLARLYSLAVRHHERLKLERAYWYTWASDYSTFNPFDYSGLVRWTGRRFVPGARAGCVPRRRLAVDRGREIAPRDLAGREMERT